jgi:hypothetical protein
MPRKTFVMSWNVMSNAAMSSLPRIVGNTSATDNTSLRREGTAERRQNRPYSGTNPEYCHSTARGIPSYWNMALFSHWQHKYVRFEVLTEVTAEATIFWHKMTWSGWKSQAFQRNILPPSSVNFNQTTQHHIPEHGNPHKYTSFILASLLIVRNKI